MSVRTLLAAYAAAHDARTTLDLAQMGLEPRLEAAASSPPFPLVPETEAAGG